ncbi:hypothetical protein BGZ63DRAFT_509390 [Mariannaea sp. PMI_226]|nr:hypothetical protein BGZ63DRAFT_509390 [Mariannaea sp. PMI_226]
MASFQTFRLVPACDEVARGGMDEWAGLADAKERRKRQNRINQRAKRQRKRIREAQEYEAKLESTCGAGHATLSKSVDQLRTTQWAGHHMAGSPTYFPLTRDTELLHVISFNVSRAILTNYFIICSIPLLTPRFCSVNRVFSLPSLQDTASISASETAVFITLPPCLMPTKIQQEVPHAGWVDLIPSPRMRDNLILALEKCHIDEDAFMMDLLGEALHTVCFGGEREDDENLSETTGNDNPTTSTPEEDGPGGEPGLISWSDPWEVTGWEVTGLFAKKWGFLLEGCQDIVRATNSWREVRDEDPITISR